MTIGILALQGDFEAHRKVLSELNVETVEVRDAETLARCNGLIIPGGESTVMSRLCDRYKLWEPLRERIAQGMGVFGTCAGLIFMARHISGATNNFAQKTLGVLDVDVARNAYGAQLDSFEADVNVPEIGEPSLRAVFIRAPQVTRVGEDVEVLSRHHDTPVVVRSGRCMAASFHPEVAGDVRLHQLWLDDLSCDSRE